MIVINASETINQIIAYVNSKGYVYDDGVIENVFLCLKSKPFLAIFGCPGTGKTSLARLFSEGCGANDINGRYKMIYIDPILYSSSSFIGKTDLNGDFIPSEFTEFVYEASKNTDLPYFLCLDEVNALNPEQHLSSIMSAIETKRRNDDNEIITDCFIPNVMLGNDYIAIQKYKNLYLPENLYIFATLNFDKLSHDLSPKLIDRINIITLDAINAIPELSTKTDFSKPATVHNSFLKQNYIDMIDFDSDFDYIELQYARLQNLNSFFKFINASLTWRAQNEIIFYLINNRKYGLILENNAIDNIIMQRILPKINGNNSYILNSLCKLFVICISDFNDNSDEYPGTSFKMYKYLKNKRCRYIRAAEKIINMVRKYEENNLTSFFL